MVDNSVYNTDTYAGLGLGLGVVDTRSLTRQDYLLSDYQYYYQCVDIRISLDKSKQSLK